MLSAIAAVDNENGLGFQGSLQFHIREDLRRFAALTRGHTVIYGRRTLGTFPGGKPLKDRRNIILSRKPGYAVEGAETVPSVKEALRVCGDDAFVIGGASVYRQFWPYVDTLYLTRVLTSAPHDVTLPDVGEDFSLTEESEIFTDEKSGLSYRFLTYRRDPETQE